MVKIVEQIIIDEEQERVFEIAQDYDLRLEWDPFLKDIRFVSEDKSLHRGLKVWVKAHNDLEMTVEYLNYSPPKHVSMKMIDGPWIFSEFSGLWAFEKTEADKTKVTFKYEFRPNFILWPGYLIIKYRLQNDMKERLKALKLYCEKNQKEKKLN